MPITNNSKVNMLENILNKNWKHNNITNYNIPSKIITTDISVKENDIKLNFSNYYSGYLISSILLTFLFIYIPAFRIFILFGFIILGFKFAEDIACIINSKISKYNKFKSKA